MLVLLDIFFISKCQRVDQTQQNTLDHSSRMFSIRGNWSDLLVLLGHPPAVLFLRSLGGLFVFLEVFTLALHH